MFLSAGLHIRFRHVERLSEMIAPDVGAGDVQERFNRFGRYAWSVWTGRSGARVHIVAAYCGGGTKTNDQARAKNKGRVVANLVRGNSRPGYYLRQLRSDPRADGEGFGIGLRDSESRAECDLSALHARRWPRRLAPLSVHVSSSGNDAAAVSK